MGSMVELVEATTAVIFKKTKQNNKKNGLDDFGSSHLSEMWMFLSFCSKNSEICWVKRVGLFSLIKDILQANTYVGTV